MSHEIDWQLLARYLADECSPAEGQAVEAWLEGDPSRRQLLDELARIWDASADPSSPTVHDMDLEAEWNRLSDAMEAADARQQRPSHRTPAGASDRPARPSRQRRSRTGTPSLQHALHAVLIGLVLVGSIWLGMELWGSSPSSEPVFREVIAERGERANVQLVDGTNVTLNVDSRLRIPTAFDEDERVVYLEGEAYFDVATDSTRPFIVHVNEAVVDVHGTAFNVRSYPEERRVQVAVVEGAVSLRAQQLAPAGDETAARLEPGQVGRLDQHATQVTTRTVDSVEPLLGWMEGRLVFDNAPLREVTARLERWYNLQFDIADPALDSLHLTASLKSRSIHNVLDVITASLDLQYHIHQNTVVLSDDAPAVRSPQSK